MALGLDSGVNGAVFERDLTMSKEKHTLLLNGLRFVTRENNSVRTTKVLEAPGSSNFQAGDTIVSYVSTFTELVPGDVLICGTPTGAGARFDPPIWLKPGDVVEVEAEGIGILCNGVEDEA